MPIWDWLLNPARITVDCGCLGWAPGLAGLLAASDAIIGLSCLSIAATLAVFAWRRRDLHFGWFFSLFVGFALAGVTIHIISIVTLWVPAYGIEGVVKAIAAAVSIGAAVVLWALAPKFLSLPSAAQFERLGRELTASVAETERTQDLLRKSEARFKAVSFDLEQRVAQQTAELTSSNREMKTALEQRDILIREVYHRVKNNLQTVDALIAAHSRQLTDEPAKIALRNLRQRVHALGLVHQQLMESKDLKTFDIAPFLKDLSKNIIESSAQDGVSLSVESIPLAVGIDFAIPLGLLVTELVTNSLKHAFPDGVGKIAVVLERSGDNNLALIVSDNGTGQAGAQLAPFATYPGRGINIITGLVNQLKGTLAMQGENGTRTEIILAVPVMP